MTASVSSQGVASAKAAAFADPELYRQALRNMQAEIVPVGKGKFHAELSRVDFRQLWIQRGRENLPRIASVYTSTARVSISFASRMDQAPTSDSGMEVLPGDVVFHSPGKTYHVRTSGPSQWAAMSLTPEDLAAVGRAITGRELTAPAASFRMRPVPALMSRLLQLHEAAGQIANAPPDTLGHPEVARALEQHLLHAMACCLAVAPPVAETHGHRRRTAILERLEAMLTANYDRPLHLAEICTATGASERTLRVCCQEQLGMGPNQYLWLRRMNLARRALLRGTPAATTVTEVATSLGFWELGRFAVRYRTLFGESPSASLASPSIDLRTAKSHPFELA